jgi:NTP pyrophosphatase (non-canonical NTP hydrolase)
MYQKIFEHYGTQHQLLKLAEECSELSAAIVKYINNEGGSIEKIITEIADVLILIRQFQLASGNEIEAIALQKVQRQLDRISKLC